MRIDNSAALAWRKCPTFYYEKYVKQLERNSDSSALDFGKRMHQLLEDYYLEMGGYPRKFYPAHPNEAVELEAQAMMAAYRNQYPLEGFDILDVERTIQVPLPGSDHVYVAKMDLVVRDIESGMLEIVDHKTESRSSKRNHPEAWTARSQASLYLWAGEEVYGEEFRDLLLNVLRRQSPKGQVGPEFPPRQRLQRTKDQKIEAVRDLIWVADQIQECERTGNWPSFTESCHNGYFPCDFYKPCTYGWSPELMTLYRPAEKYLDL